jgi:hypothetical protein
MRAVAFERYLNFETAIIGFTVFGSVDFVIFKIEVLYF